MLALALLLSATLFVSGEAHAGVTPGTPEITPRRQALDLVVDPTSETWKGGLRAWLTVHRPLRRFHMRLRGPVVSRVEMNQASGTVPLIFAAPRRDTLHVETERELVPGPAGLDVGFTGSYADSGDGFARRGPRTVALARAAVVALPAWPQGFATPWTADVHVPAGCVVRANLPRTEITTQGSWRTWSFASSRPLPADSLRIEVSAPQRRLR